MLFGTFLDKVKLAIQSQSCIHCGQKTMSDSLRFCVRCTETLGLRGPQPIVDTPKFVCYAATVFNPNIKRLLYGHKFGHLDNNALQLSGLLTHYWANLLLELKLQNTHPENVMVVPIPAHADREHHVHHFASRFARYFGYEYVQDGLLWTREVQQQHLINDKRERFTNITGSLAVNVPAPSEHERIIIVDDLTTTGATLHEASRAFFNTLGSQVDIVSLAVTKVPLRQQTL